MLQMSESEETYTLLPIEECAIHPLARIRFDYQVDGLAESIRAMGQVQPGKAVEQPGVDSSGARYLVYVGCRRLVACKKASVKRFKALVVKTIEDSRLQSEVLTENVKRTNLSVLEELNVLANYSKGRYSLEELAKDIGLSQRLVRGRVELATLLQEKGMIATLYKVERNSGFTFTHRHIEKIAAFEETKWLPLAIQAAERNWKTEDIESLGTRFTLESLIENLPTWGRQFIPVTNRSSATSKAAGATVDTATQTAGGAGQAANDHQWDQPEQDAESLSRYQTITGRAQFLICPECGSESVIEFPWCSPATLLRPGKAAREGGAVALAKESVPLQMGVALVPCTSETCGRTLVVTLDQSGDGLVLGGRTQLLSLVGKGSEPEDGGTGALVWDARDGSWLKAQFKGEDSTYQGYDEQAKRWVVPVTVGSRTAR
jgi:ParB/RepB/Spo0J family partition protein